MSIHDGTSPNEALPEDETGKVVTLNQTSFVVAESVYVGSAKSVKYIIEDTGTVAASVHKRWDFGVSERIWDAAGVVMGWQYITLADMPVYKALLDVVTAKMQQLDSEFPPGSKVK